MKKVVNYTKLFYFVSFYLLAIVFINNSQAATTLKADDNTPYELVYSENNEIANGFCRFYMLAKPFIKAATFLVIIFIGAGAVLGKLSPGVIFGLVIFVGVVVGAEELLSSVVGEVGQGGVAEDGTKGNICTTKVDASNTTIISDGTSQTAVE